MYKKIMFILLTMLFMSGSCNLDKTAILLKKAQTASKTNTPIPIDNPSIDTPPISLTDTHKDAIKFNYLTFSIMIPPILNVQVKSVLISTTEDALRAANITSLSEAKSMREKDKLRELIKSLTFTFRSIDTSNNGDEFTMKGDYKNLKIIYDGLRKTANDPSLQPKLKIDGKDVEFNKGFFINKTLHIYLFSSSFDSALYDYSIFFKEEECSKMKDFLSDVLGINDTANFKKYLP